MGSVSGRGNTTGAQALRREGILERGVKERGHSGHRARLGTVFLLTVRGPKSAVS